MFFQQPYNIQRPAEYSSSRVSEYAKICYVSYFSPIYYDEIYDECVPFDYLRDLSFFFTQHEADDRYINSRFNALGLDRCRVIMTGYPRYDGIERYRDAECGLWNSKDTFKMLWTPRWTTNEGNCHFFDYRDAFTDYCKNEKDVELTFRPHPQAFREWAATGEMSAEEQTAYRRLFVDSNMHLDESNDYMPLLFSSDCLITDRSTMIIDYLFTGKPIVYCTNTSVHEKIMSELAEIMYTASSWGELSKVLSDLKDGLDPLREKRMRTAETIFKTGTGHAGRKIKDIIKEDALKQFGLNDRIRQGAER